MSDISVNGSNISYVNNAQFVDSVDNVELSTKNSKKSVAIQRDLEEEEVLIRKRSLKKGLRDLKNSANKV